MKPHNSEKKKEEKGEDFSTSNINKYSLICPAAYAEDDALIITQMSEC